MSDSRLILQFSITASAVRKLISLSAEQVETLLKTQDPAVSAAEAVPTSFGSSSNVSGVGAGAVPNGDFNVPNPSINIGGVNADRWGFNGDSPQPPLDNMGFTTDMNMGMNLDGSTFTWEMIGLGLEEPLPPQDTIDELCVMFFTNLLGNQAHIAYPGIKSILTASTHQYR